MSDTRIRTNNNQQQLKNEVKDYEENKENHIKDQLRDYRTGGAHPHPLEVHREK